MLISGKMGVELWAGEVVMNLRDEYDIKLALIPPFENQDERWPEPVQQIYREMTAAADFSGRFIKAATVAHINIRRATNG